MISRLCRSSYCGYKLLNKSSWLKFSNEISLNHSAIFIPRSFIHSFENKDVTPDTISNVVTDFSIPDAPIIDASVVLNAMGEQSFASLGLNAYSPPGLIQYILENVHNYLHLPWWACIGITAVLLRTCILPVMLSQRRVLVSYQNNISKMTKLMVEALTARDSGNSLLMIMKMKEFEVAISQNNMSAWSMVRPMFIQAPIFISVFTALRGMAAAPVASLQTGGLSWFTDLTVYDPYYILPMITAISLAIVIESGAEAPTPQAKQFQMALRALPVFTFILICHFPSTLALYWTYSNLYSLAFVYLLKIPQFQKALNIPNMIALEKIDNPNNYGMKDTMDLIKSIQEVQLRHKAEEMRWGREHQEEIVRVGFAAAAARKKLKEEMKLKEIENGSDSKTADKV